MYLVGWAFKHFLRFGPTMIGMWFGYYGSTWVVAGVNGAYSWTSPACNHGCADAISPVYSVIYQFSGMCIGGLLGYCYSFVFIIAIQTFAASYLIVRGTTFWYNFGYPSEVVLINAASVQMNGLLKLQPAFYVYVFIILLLWLISFRSALREAWKDGGKAYQADEDD